MIIYEYQCPDSGDQFEVWLGSDIGVLRADSVPQPNPTLHSKIEDKR